MNILLHKDTVANEDTLQCRSDKTRRRRRRDEILFC